jgi:hypothetical protein
MDYLEEGEGLECPADASPVEFLQAIYRDHRQPMHRRLRAAVECAPFCHPQLKATAVILGSDFSTRLENAMKRSQAVRLIEAQTIEAAE